MSRSRPLSRSPPASRHTSRSPTGSRSHSPSLAERTAGLSLSHPHPHPHSSRHEREMRERAVAEVAREHSRQQKKYHTKKGAQRLGGRQKGNKGRMDTRVKLDRGGMWE